MPLSPPNLDLDRIVDAYETACQRMPSGDIDLRDFVPGKSHIGYAEIVVELCRVDLERSWRPDVRNRLTRYEQMFPDVFHEHRQLERLAFEEYRLRRQDGETVDPAEYAVRYGVSVGHWNRNLDDDSAAINSWEDNAAFQELSQLRPEMVQFIAGETGNLPEPGTQFLGFHLMEELGRGAFGRVYLAKQGDLANRLVVLKVTAINAAESQRLARLQHSYITPIFSVHRWRQFQAVCMPYLGRYTLADVLRCIRSQLEPPDTVDVLESTTQVATGKPVTMNPLAAKGSDGVAVLDHTLQWPRFGTRSHVEAICRIAAQVAEGLAHAHEHGVLHCDLKPANILLSDLGVPIIVDFNTSQDMSRAGGCSAMIGGTLPYMSPEQMLAFSGTGTLDARSDIYSLGVVLCELLTGKHPFPIHNTSLDEALPRMLADRRGMRPYPRERFAAISPGLQAIVQRCLEFSPAHRYQSAAQLHEDLTRHLENRPLCHVREPSVKERVRKWSRRHPQWVSTSMLVTVTSVIIASLGLAWWGRTNQIAKLEAHQLFENTLVKLPIVWVEAAASPLDPQRREDFARRASEICSAYQVGESGPWYELPFVRYLTVADQQRLRNELGGMFYLQAEIRLREAKRLPLSEREATLAEAKRWHHLAKASIDAAGNSLSLQRQQAELSSIEKTDAPNGRPIAAVEEANSTVDKLWLASYHLLRDETRPAEELLSSIVHDDPRHYSARFLLGNCEARLGKLNEAEGSFTACIALRPAEYAGWFHRGLVRLDRKDFAAAHDDFGVVLSYRPDLSAAYVNRALAHHGCGETDNAIQDLSQAIGRGATETRVWLLRSQLRRLKGDEAGARADQEHWTRLVPNDELSWVTRGVTKLASDPQGAMNDFREALRVNPRSRPALQNLAHVLAERLGQHDAAISILDEALIHDPYDSILLGSRGVLRARLDRAEDAVTDARDACRVSGNAAFAWYQAACVHALLMDGSDDHRDKAVGCLARALAEQPDLVNLTANDHDLDHLRMNDQFKSLIAAAKLMLQTAAPREEETSR